MNRALLDAAERAGWTFVQAVAGSIAVTTVTDPAQFDWQAALAIGVAAAVLSVLKTTSVQLTVLGQKVPEPVLVEEDPFGDLPAPAPAPAPALAPPPLRLRPPLQPQVAPWPPTMTAPAPQRPVTVTAQFPQAPPPAPTPAPAPSPQPASAPRHALGDPVPASTVAGHPTGTAERI